MAIVLNDLSYPSETVENFKREKIYVTTVTMLTDKELMDLGVKTVGERATLRKKCREVEQNKKVSVEMKRIMGPSQTTLRYCLDSRSLVSSGSGSSVGLEVARRPKRKSKGSHGIQKRKVSVNFQKKIIVFDYMGSNPPKAFTRCDKNICLSGLLPLLSVDATEKTIRKEICDVLSSCSSPDLSFIQPNDFEFISMNGKHGCVPQCKNGFEWNGRAVKELAGSGCLYIRLTRSYQSYSDDDNELPPGPLLTAPLSTSHTQVNDDPLSTSHTQVNDDPLSTTHTQFSDGPLLTSHTQVNDESCSLTAEEVSGNGSTVVPQSQAITLSSDEEPVATTAYSTSITNVKSPTLIISDSQPCSSSTGADSFDTDFPKLLDLFPNMSKDQLQFVYQQCMSFDHAVEILLVGPTLNSLRGLTMKFNTEGCPKIRLDANDDDDDWMEAALAFYKCRTFDKKASVRISIRNQPAVDTGGIRRQFFFVVFQKLSSETVGIFDGLPNRLRPAYKASTLASGVLSTIGTMIAHSFLLDGQGFPYMAEYCYYYIAGCYELALSCVTIEDTSANVKAILNQFLAINTKDDLNSFEQKDELMDLMDQSGCDLCLRVCNKEAIAHCIILHDAFYKRKPHLDSIAKGLEVLGVQTLISNFPTVCKSVFVSDGILEGETVTSMLRPHPQECDMSAEEHRVWQYLLWFIRNANEEDLKKFLQFVTGTAHITGIIIVNFDSSTDQAIAVGTCGKELILSRNIVDKENFVSALQTLIVEMSYTMA